MDVLKSLFGVAMVADAHKLHESLNDLQASYLDIAHSLSEQLTCTKKLDFSIDLNADAITNLSRIVKDVVMQSQERFQEVAKEIMWLNLYRTNVTASVMQPCTRCWPNVAASVLQCMH